MTRDAKLFSCPICDSHKIRRSSWRPGEGLHRFFFHRGYRCRDCQHKFWRFRPLQAVISVSLLLLVGIGVWLLARPAHDNAAGDQSRFPKLMARARLGNAAAQLEVAVRYQEGDGVIRNDRAAGQWLEKAAAQGGADAEFQYAMALLEGRGVVQDYQSAFKWMSKAAHQGYAPAQYQLGQLYQFGTGTLISKPDAYLWYNVAAAQGLEQAAKARDAVVWQLPPEQVRTMQQRARALLPGAAATTK